MSEPYETVATLRIFGDTLVPEEISQALGCEPTRSELKGQVFIGPVTGNKRIAKTSSWRLENTNREPGDLDSQISEILAKTTQDLNVWKSLSDRFEIDLFCGVFADNKIVDFSILPESMTALGERGIEIVFDVYCDLDENKIED